MKNRSITKKVLITLIVVTLGFTTQAQLFNSGFENWSGGEPDDWTTNNDISSAGNSTDDLGNPVAAVDLGTTSPSEGTKFIVLSSFNLQNSTSPQAPNNEYGAVISQVIQADQQYTSFSFDVKYDIKSGDQGWINIYVFDANSAVLGSQSSYFMGAQTSWKTVTLPLVYTGTADRFQVTITSSERQVNPMSSMTIEPGSWLAVDNITSIPQGNGGTNTNSIEKNNQNAIVKVFPNPAQDFLYVFAKEQKASKISIQSILGKEIVTTELRKVKEKINISALNHGVYIYYISNDKGEKIKVGKLIIK